LRLLRLASIVWLVLLVPIGGAVGYGRSQIEQTTLESFGLHKCSDRLCFLDIAPGVTRWSKALAILEKHGALQWTRQEGIYFIDNIRINIEYNPETQLVTYISIIDQTGNVLPLTAGDIVEYLGNPCRFNPDTYQSLNLILIYRYAFVTIGLDAPYTSPTTPIKYIEMESISDNCISGEVWPGFTTSKQYWNLYLNIKD